ncbi:SpaH/EbpB family LPXTG-anchored major pilin [Enterococcus gilvus]|uniref:SpaH/EbpB family LPXTG-anchored major pilin n=1 Tax=Enterococcus gilvus TaxID=160453 RepID=UPI003D6C6F11
MKKPSIIFSLLAIGFLLIGNLFSMQSVEAAEKHTVYLHKQATQENQDGQGLLTEKKGINGAEFTVIDITHFVRTHSTSHEEAVEQAKAVAKSEVADLEVGEAVPNRLGMEVVAKGKTARMDVPNSHGQNESMDGVLKLSLTKKNKAHDASYLFIETASVSQAGPSDPIIMHFPIEDELNNTITAEFTHIYSKNDSLVEIPTEPKIEKQLAEDHADFTYGEAINYEIKVNIPIPISRYQYFKVIDLPDPALLADVNSITVADQKNQPIDSASYQVSAEGNGFIINFVPNKLVEYQEMQLTISYQMKIKEGAAADTPFFNKALLQYNDSIKDQEQTSTSKEVLTGGYRFVKVDADTRQLKLKDATFVVKNKKEQYLTTDYKWKNSETPSKDEDLLKIVSTQEGVFELKGLAYGTYQIEEIVAPKGYRLLEKPIEFKIEKNTYLAGETTGLLEVLNSKLPSTGGGETGDVGKATNVNAKAVYTVGKNTRRLPSTGERILDVGLFGGLLILLVFVIYSIRARQQQKND